MGCSVCYDILLLDFEVFGKGLFVCEDFLGDWERGPASGLDGHLG